MGIRTVLVAIDGSEPARRALAQAAELANACGARMVIAHAIPAAEGDETFQAFEQYVEASATTLLTQTEQALEESCDQVETRLLRGDPVVELAALAEAVAADLVVVGSRGLGAVSRAVLGSVSDRLLHTLPVPILVVR